MSNTIHPTAILEGNVELGQGNDIGPFVVIRGNVTLGNNNKLETGTCIENNVTIGDHNHFYPYVTIGCVGEMGSKGDRLVDEGKVIIGNQVTIREFVCVHSPVYSLETRIHDQVYLMNKSYVAHDCVIGKGSVLSASVLLGGRCEIGAYVNIGLGVTVHQRIHIGSHSMIGMQAVITRDIVPYATVVGNPARILRFNRKAGEQQGFEKKWLDEMDLFFQKDITPESDSQNPMQQDIQRFLIDFPESLKKVKSEMSE